jgi:cytochrome c peroxidase
MRELTANRARTRLVLAVLMLGAACHERSAPDTAAPATSTAGQASASASPRASSVRPGPSSFYADRFSKRPNVARMTDLGRKVFFDESLSASGKMSCATCHDPRFGYGPPNDRSTQLGGPDMKSAGVRAVPSLRYLHTLPRFAEHHFDEAVDESVDQGPTGGHTWDGRVDTTHEQAKLPFTSPIEMANPTMDAVLTKVEGSAYAAQFKETFGDEVFSDSEKGLTAILLSLEVFQQSPKDFYPYDSRYDAWLRRKGELSPAEERGRALFNDPRKANCATCHPSQIRGGAFPQFTDFGYIALGVPRNTAIVANKDPAFFDMGLCGPQRTDLSSHKEYCGEFRVPTLRNVGVRHVFFHNGVFHSLRQVLEFYAERDSNPGKWYPKAGGHVNAFDDLPAAYRTNVNREPPFGGKPGRPPSLTKTEIDDIIAFLGTLTDADLAAN